MSSIAERRCGYPWSVVFAGIIDAGPNAILQVRLLWSDVERGGGITMSKTRAGFVMLFGMSLTIIGGQIASSAANHIGSPETDLLYDLLTWNSTLGAIGGLCAFFWGAKEFAASGK